MTQDAIETAQESGQRKLAEDLLRFFAESGEKEFFTVCSYTCNEIISPDLVLELAWRYGMNDFAFPFFIQMVRDLTHKVEKVEKKHEEREKKDEQKAEQDAFRPLSTMGGMDGLGMMMGAELSPYPMLTGPDSTFSSGFPLAGGLGQPGLGGFGGATPGLGQSGLGGFGRPGF